ncbi:MAG: hypothetical protein CMK38_06315 [Porticoccaceae bacterium]|nr:hypothetical protein [Porticoccaceae bacterium]|tara:strand:+ start:77 stop:562 length:486 start_codon:yes stop_codon:yes gene_type:complete
MKKKLKDLKNLKYLSDAIVSFELKKYEVISKFAETSDWNQVYVNDSRYELIRLIMLSNFVSKGFFTMSDLVGATNLNTRSIERLISRATKQGYFEKIPSKDKRVVEYHPTKEAFSMVAMHLSLMEVLVDSLGPGIKEKLEKNIGVSMDQVKKIISELQEAN